MYNLDKKKGNTGLLGKYFWRIEDSDGRSALEKCYSWAGRNIYELSPIRTSILDWYNLLNSDWEMACPCTWWQASLDRGRFSWIWWYSWPEVCYVSRRSKFVFYYTVTGLVGLRLRQECCYSTDFEDWGSLKFGPPDGGHVKVTTFTSSQTFPTDDEAYKYCCVDANQCDLFYLFRPSDSCSLYRPPPRRRCYCIL